MASISGLSSGLDTASIVKQLMQLEAAPQTRLKTRVSTEKSVITTLQGLNTKIAGLQAKAEALAKPEGWSPVTAVSSNPAVTVQATAGASPTNLTVSVLALPRTFQLASVDAAGLSDSVLGVGTDVVINKFDGSPLSLATDGTLQGVINAINDPANETGLRAMAVRDGEDQYRLLVESATAGAGKDFELTDADGNQLLGGYTSQAGSDASISLGGGLTLTDPDGTFTDVLPGVTLTVGPTAKTGDVAQVGITRDTESLATKLKELVDGINAVLTDVKTQTASGANGTKAGPLAGDGALRSFATALVESVYPSDGTSLASLGIQVNRSGKLDFDSAKFTQAYTADPVGVSEKFSSAGDGLASRVAAVTASASDRDGTITSAIAGRRTGIDRMEDRIVDWDRRLELRRSNLERQFTSLEKALNQMSSQSNWLSGQLSALSNG